MEYSISQVSKAMDIPASTLRYYDKEGLLPTIERKDSGHRLFTEKEIEMLGVIECLKETGMSIKDIKLYAQLTELGDATLEERYQLFQHQKNELEKQLSKLHESLKLLQYKCHYYESAIEAGTEKIHFPIQMSQKNTLRFEKLKQMTKK